MCENFKSLYELFDSNLKNPNNNAMKLLMGNNYIEEVEETDNNINNNNNININNNNNINNLSNDSSNNDNNEEEESMKTTTIPEPVSLEITGWEIHRYRKDKSIPNGTWQYKGYAIFPRLENCQAIVENLTNDFESRF